MTEVTEPKSIRLRQKVYVPAILVRWHHCNPIPVPLHVGMVGRPRQGSTTEYEFQFARCIAIAAVPEGTFEYI